MNPNGIKIIVKRPFEGLELAKFIKKADIEIPYSLVQKLLRKRAIRVNGKSEKYTYLVKTDDEIFIPAESRVAKKTQKIVSATLEDAEKYLLPNIIYKDKNIIALNKPQGISTQGGSGVGVSIDSLLDFLRFDDYEERPALAHRLDKDTSGVLLIARTREAAQILGEGFKNRDIDKSYLTLVAGKVPMHKGRIAKPVGKRLGAGGNEKMMVDYANGKIAVTEYEVVERFGSQATLLHVFPKTGRKHQIRVHLADEGFPIIGDGKYGGTRAFIEGLSNTMHLHSWKISHKHNYFPEIIAPIPDIFKEMD